MKSGRIRRLGIFAHTPHNESYFHAVGCFSWHLCLLNVITCLTARQQAPLYSRFPIWVSAWENLRTWSVCIVEMVWISLLPCTIRGTRGQVVPSGRGEGDCGCWGRGDPRGVPIGEHSSHVWKILVVWLQKFLQAAAKRLHRRCDVQVEETSTGARYACQAVGGGSVFADSVFIFMSTVPLRHLRRNLKPKP